MFDFIPIYSYTPLFYYTTLLVVLLTCINTVAIPLHDKRLIHYLKNVGFVFFIGVLLYMGLRPIHGVFTDMTTYANIFVRYQAGQELTSDSDVLFRLFTKFSSQIMTVHAFFFICASLYVVPLYIVCKKWFKAYWFYAFLMLVISFSFWAYGTNGIRNGIAGSLFLMGISREKRLWQILWIIIAINVHNSMLLPTMGFALAQVYNKPKQLIVFWVFCIPLSFLGGEVWQNFFAVIGFEDNRVSYFTTEATTDKFSSTGFRWDFLLYSATAVYAGWYYIVKRNFNDKLYFWLFNTYTFSNAFWILVIRANFSNRFAYLSWFLMGLVIVYPLLTKQLVKRQNQLLASIILVYYAFTFFMNIILQ